MHAYLYFYSTSGVRKCFSFVYDWYLSSAPMWGTWLYSRERCSVKGSLKNCLNSYDEHVRVFAECIRSNWAPLLPTDVLQAGVCLSQFCLSVRAITCEYTYTLALGT